MTIEEKIQHFIDNEYLNRGKIGEGFQPTLRFGISNYESNNSFKVNSISEAENIVISFISYAKKGEIFNNNVYDINKQLYLNVYIIHHK